MYQWDREYQQRGMAFSEHLEDAFGRMRELGFDGVQSRLAYADTPEKADRFAEICRRAGVEIASLYGNCKLYDRDALEGEVASFLEAVDAARWTGCSLIALNMATPHGRPKRENELEVQVRGLEAIGEEAAKMGVRIALHNHTPEMENEAREFRYVMGHVVRDAIGVCLDVAWAAVAGVSPLDLIHEIHPRLFDLHVRNLAEGWFTQSVPAGEISYAQVLDLLAQYRYDGWLVVELSYDDRVDVTRSFEQNITRSIWYLKGLVAAWGTPSRT
jgi:sugar phosphate isomerase/epimerase